jgi:hypothetical protein
LVEQIILPNGSVDQSQAFSTARSELDNKKTTIETSAHTAGRADLSRGKAGFMKYRPAVAILTTGIVFTALAGCLGTIGPDVSATPLTPKNDVVVFGHRGAAGLASEN